MVSVHENKHSSWAALLPIVTVPQNQQAKHRHQSVETRNKRVPGSTQKNPQNVGLYTDSLDILRGGNATINTGHQYLTCAADKA